MNPSPKASLNATALAAMTCISGPPWYTGKIVLSSRAAYCALARIKPPRGPRKVLWVVEVMKSAMPTGDGYTPAAINPA
ncbi:hypothetical protein D3C76_1832660 [compost metagenome]